MILVDLQAFLGDPMLKGTSCYTANNPYLQLVSLMPSLEKQFPVANTNQHFSCREQMDEQYPGTLGKA